MGDRLLDNSSRGAFDGSFKVTGDNKGRSPRSMICEPMCVCVCASAGECGTTKSVVDFFGPVSRERFGGIIASNFFSKGTTRVSTMQLHANYETMQLVSHYYLWSLNKKIGVAKCRNGMGNGLPSC